MFLRNRFINLFDPIRTQFRAHVKSRCFKLDFRANAPVASDDYHGIYLFHCGSLCIDPTYHGSLV